MEKKESQVQWQPIIELLIVLFTILGTTIPLYIHTDNKMNTVIEAIRQDMKEFHGRLCAIEERNKK